MIYFNNLKTKLLLKYMTAKKLLIQVYSDIHIELWNKIPELPVKAKYLFLAGDICNQIHPFQVIMNTMLKIRILMNFVSNINTD